jgi:hypothetical protein
MRHYKCFLFTVIGSHLQVKSIISNVILSNVTRIVLLALSLEAKALEVFT